MVMNSETKYENYPLRIIIISNLVTLFTYISGTLIIYQTGVFWTLLYILYIVFIEIRLLRTGCVHCYYYGKVCAFGRGKLCSLIFRKGDPQKFADKQITWKDLVPDMLIGIIPLIAGISTLIMDFRWLILILVLLLVLLNTQGNAFVRGTLACTYCKQLKLGCPAANLFWKEKKQDF